MNDNVRLILPDGREAKLLPNPDLPRQVSANRLWRKTYKSLQVPVEPWGLLLMISVYDPKTELDTPCLVDSRAVKEVHHTSFQSISSMRSALERLQADSETSAQVIESYWMLLTDTHITMKKREPANMTIEKAWTEGLAPCSPEPGSAQDM
jgi:hypothetical protein